MIDRIARVLVVVLAACLLLVASGCDDGDSDGEFGPNFPIHDFTLNLVAFNPHVGQAVKVRVVSMDTGEETGRAVVYPLPAPEHAITVPMSLAEGERYMIDFYADLSAGVAGTPPDGYDAPPVDHAWRLQVGPVDGDVAVDFSHDTNWIDIQFPD